jgi:hypothetical protein
LQCSKRLGAIENISRMIDTTLQVPSVTQPE